MADTAVSALATDNQKSKSPKKKFVGLGMSIQEWEANQKILEKMNTRVTNLKNPRYKEKKPTLLFNNVCISAGRIH